MKPRRISAPLTDEDCDIWYSLRIVQDQRPYALSVVDLSRHVGRLLEGDRRDADLMFHLERCRAHELADTVDGKPLNGMAYAHSLLRARDWLGIGGEDPFNITYCA